MFPWTFWKVFQNSYSAEHMRTAAASNLLDLIKSSFEFHKSMTSYLHTKRNKRIVKNDLLLKMSLNITSNNNEKTSLDRKSKVYIFCETHDHQFQRGKNKQRHMTCLTSYRPVHQNKRFQYARAHFLYLFTVSGFVLFCACEILSQKKNKKFKTVLMTSIILLLNLQKLSVIIF